MKIRNRLNILSPLVAAMFILSLFSGVVAAQAPQEQFEKEQDRIHKEKYDNTKEQFEKAKEEFEKTREKFKSATDKRSKEEVENKAKEYLIKAINHTVAHLEVLRTKVNNSENKGIIPFDAVAVIDAHLVQLEQLRTEVQQATTVQDLRNANQELKDLWVKIRLETAYYLGIVLNHRITQFITKADNVSARMSAAIEKLKSQGKDTSKLEDDREKFNNLINAANNSHAKTLSLFASHEGFDSGGMVTDIKAAQSFIREASNLQKDTIHRLKEASRQVLDFVKDFRKLTGGKALIQGTGTLAANGSGRAVIEGNVTVTLSGLNGTLKVSGNANVTTDGKGTREVLGNGDIKYEGFGSATISGENIRVEISGSNISLKATGTGSAVLNGKGTFRTERDFGVSGEWKKEE